MFLARVARALNLLFFPPVVLYQKLVDETQMPKPQKYTDTLILTRKLFLVGLQGL